MQRNKRRIRGRVSRRTFLKGLVGTGMLLPLGSFGQNRMPLTPFHTAATRPPFETYLLDLARDTWRCIAHFMNEDTGLPYNRSDPGNPQTASDHIGLYLACVVAAMELGFISRDEALTRLRRTLDSMERLEKWEGFFYRWYNADTLERMFVEESTLYSIEHGWIAAGLITTRSAFPELSDRCSNLLQGIDWMKLYSESDDLFYLGYDPVRGEPTEWMQGWLVSEGRITSFIAIGLGQVPPGHWERLERETDELLFEYYRLLTLDHGDETGLFTFLMPDLFVDERASFVGRCAANFAYAQKIGAGSPERFRDAWHPAIWGWGECEMPGTEPDEYIGFRQLRDDVVAPYVSALALYYWPREVVENLQRLEAMGARPEGFGFRDSVKWNPETGQVEIVDDSYLPPYHQGEILLSITNYLTDAIHQIFNADPIVARAKRSIQDFRAVTPEIWRIMKKIFEEATYQLIWLQEEGYDVAPLEEKLLEAKLAFNREEFERAEQLAEEVLQGL